MPIAADYPLLDVLWTMLAFFGGVIWFWTLIKILSDVFRRDDLTGVQKAGWTLFAITAPFLGVLIYLAVNGRGIAERDAEQLSAARAQADDYIRSVAASEGPATEIARAKQLLDKGAIDQAEFDALKAKALA